MNSISETSRKMMLARPLRVGLLGDPYFWGVINPDDWKSRGVELKFIAFAGTGDALHQDILLSSNEGGRSLARVSPKDERELVPEFSLVSGDREVISPELLRIQFFAQLGQVVDQVIDQIKQHESHYLKKEKVIAGYGMEIIRATNALGLSPIHIENDALIYLATMPWRNAKELQLAVSRMAFYAKGDVLRMTYVQDKVHDFSVSVRGISNCEPERSLIHRLVVDLLEKYDLQKTLTLLQTRMDHLAIASPSQSIPRIDSQPNRRFAA